MKTCSVIRFVGTFLPEIRFLGEILPGLDFALAAHPYLPLLKSLLPSWRIFRRSVVHISQAKADFFENLLKTVAQKSELKLVLTKEK